MSSNIKLLSRRQKHFFVTPRSFNDVSETWVSNICYTSILMSKSPKSKLLLGTRDTDLLFYFIWFIIQILRASTFWHISHFVITFNPIFVEFCLTDSKWYRPLKSEIEITISSMNAQTMRSDSHAFVHPIGNRLAFYRNSVAKFRRKNFDILTACYLLLFTRRDSRGNARCARAGGNDFR